MRPEMDGFKAGPGVERNEVGAENIGWSISSTSNGTTSLVGTQLKVFLGGFSASERSVDSGIRVFEGGSGRTEY